MFKKFWNWYERNLTLNIAIAAVLFALQLVHLYWLATDVIATKLFGTSFFPVSGFWQWVLVLIDYTEIPAIITTSLVYINEYRKGKKIKSLLYLFFINSQWLHLFWITDEFVIESFRGAEQTLLPAWLALIAILIDYLELPVIFDTLKKLINSLKKPDLNEIRKVFKEN
jgi:hypothetical protein